MKYYSFIHIKTFKKSRFNYSIDVLWRFTAVNTYEKFDSLNNKLNIVGVSDTQSAVQTKQGNIENLHPPLKGIMIG